jgi:hypothetical protein
MAEERNAYRILVGKPEEKIPLEIPIRRVEDNIKKYGEIGLYSFVSGQGLVAGSCEHSNETSSPIKCWGNF